MLIEYDEYFIYPVFASFTDISLSQNTLVPCTVYIKNILAWHSQIYYAHLLI